MSHWVSSHETLATPQWNHLSEIPQSGGHRPRPVTLPGHREGSRALRGDQGRKLNLGGIRTHQAEGQGAEPLILLLQAAQLLVSRLQVTGHLQGPLSKFPLTGRRHLLSLQLLLHQIQLPGRKWRREGHCCSSTRPGARCGPQPFSLRVMLFILKKVPLPRFQIP